MTWTNPATLPKASRWSKGRAGRGGGLGLDIVEVSRIKTVARRTPLFLSRVFAPEEIRYCRAKKKPWPHFAARFAAKEAVWKALGHGGVALKDIRVERDVLGRPYVLVQGRVRRDLELSLTHTERYAAAVALASGNSR